MDNELAGLLEAVIIKNSLMVYMNKLTEQYKAHPDFGATMAFCGKIYRKYAKVASQKVETDEMGHIVIRRDLRTKFDLN